MWGWRMSEPCLCSGDFRFIRTDGRHVQLWQTAARQHSGGGGTAATAAAVDGGGVREGEKKDNQIWRARNACQESWPPTGFAHIIMALQNLYEVAIELWPKLLCLDFTRLCSIYWRCCRRRLRRRHRRHCKPFCCRPFRLSLVVASLNVVACLVVVAGLVVFTGLAIAGLVIVGGLVVVIGLAIAGLVVVAGIITGLAIALQAS